MEIAFSGRTALVTGSTRGIGFAVARELARCGAKVIVNGRSELAVADALARLTAEIGGCDLTGVAADAATAEGASQITSFAPVVDMLVCNAATFDWIDFFATTDEDWLRHFQLNVMSAVRLSRHYLRLMLERGSGRIVLVASEAGLNLPPDMIHYGVSKAAEIALARGLAELTAGTAVTVNSVLPGPTASSDAAGFLDRYARQQDIKRDQAEAHLVASIRPTSLLRRLATVEEVANMVAYACSDLSSATNGAALRVEGGVLRHPG